ncbi:helix-turn-helix domain-containing protein [Petroclostridium sp. X23]|uniref:helix-turn-helix domain-containing protein n=1 Tax=Petroclostridium sp. X23 TaxID=3045146 RepID=UPI0024AE48C8|nr:helix-turn-helix domain-containing protein [Petroclostridium sp. X23]WHH57950.1 helix-turn-helix domain-containing protein [Petroclostridium sp. X23]
MERRKEISRQQGWEYMKELAENKEFIETHTLYTPIPHKISRCINLGSTAKIILLDLIGYMGDEHYCYPPIEDIALNCGMSHTTVQNNIKELEEKRFLIVNRNYNNTYYLLNALHLNPYILLSEVLHEVRSLISKTGVIADRQRNQFIKRVVKSEIYKERLHELSKEYDKYLTVANISYKGNKLLKVFRGAVIAELNRQYPQIALYM